MPEGRGHELEIAAVTLSRGTVDAISALESMWDAVNDARAKLGAPIARPSDCFTVTEYQERFGCSNSSALRQLNKMVVNGELEEVGRVLVPNKGGAVAPQRAFRPVKKCDQKDI